MGNDITVQAEEFFRDLIAATLAVNRFSLAVAYEIANKLRGQGCRLPSVVAALHESDVVLSLAAAGYSRGEYMTALMGARISRLACALSDAEIQEFIAAEEARDFVSIERRLLTQPGIGPVVIENLRALRRDDTS